MRANDSPPGSPAVSTRTELRQLIETLLPGDSELSSFILQQFPRIIESLRPGLSRLAKIELLLDQAEHAQLLRHLRELGVIVQPTGERANVLKMKPPMCLSIAAADFFADTLERVLSTGW